ncbi:LVIVD repeat-containing protein [Hyalangium gracile]|uniref:LVIVD repeat-containing protein n=1 Tax=Hyalangium gracile TaxID=394092 RepID=UPI001CCF8EFA|nr:hypothetical protein [Hyalangium gracile]
MMKPLRFALAVLLMSALGLGCKDDPQEIPDPGTPDSGLPDSGLPDSGIPDSGIPDSGIPDSGIPDGGYEWDGNYVPLQELGDHIDTGHLAPCLSRFTDDAGTPIPCGSREAFDLSACNRNTLSQVSPDGIYGARTRSSTATTFFGFGYQAFQVSSSGGPEYVNSLPVIQKQVDGQTFYVAGKRTLTDGGSTLQVFMGCQAQNAQNFTGCYQQCVNDGARRSHGTFDASRLQRVQEPELSGIELVSETAVSLGFPVDVYVIKQHAYVVSINLGTRIPNGGLTVFDVSDPAHPVFKKQVTLAGDTYWNSVWAKGNALYVGSGKHGVIVYDITNPADPQLVRSVPGDTFDVHTIYIDGDRMYAQAAGANQVLIFDVSNPLEPVLLNRYTVPTDNNGLGYPHDAFAYQNRLYINQMGQGFYVVDVTDGANPQPLGSYTYDTHIYNPTHANAVGTFAGKTLAFEGGEANNAHLRVLDVSDPARIVKIGEYAMRPQTSIHNMILKGKRLYVAWYAEGVRVLDVSNPTQIKEIAYANTYRDGDLGLSGGLYIGAIGMRVPGDGYVYVVDTSRGLMIFREP